MALKMRDEGSYFTGFPVFCLFKMFAVLSLSPKVHKLCRPDLPRTGVQLKAGAHTGRIPYSPQLKGED